MITGRKPQDVVSLITQRLLHGRSHEPGRRLGLVVEGGAMKGAYTGGSLLGLHLLGTTPIFDGVYATSAGAINAAHYLSGEGHRKAATYYKALADGRFFNPWRLMMPVDIDFVFDTVLRQELPLEMERVAASNTPFKVALLNCEDAVGEMKSISGVDALAWDTLKASVAMPVVYNKKITLPGGTYVDGGMVIPYPLEQALADGMTDVVVLLCRNPSLGMRPRGLFQYLMWSLVFAKGNPKMIKVFEDWLPTIRRLDSIAMGQHKAAENVRILSIGPTNPKIRTGTQNRTLLRDSSIEMTLETLALFGKDDSSLLELMHAGHI
ncbi:MAG: hypothetical protein B7Z47_03150 [Chthoniobacter sp. 12-60-6]|nr:MAG: hypothetical protein B7Z47_03150 [Chthoniobacter sp. 12-60-6]